MKSAGKWGFRAVLAAMLVVCGAGMAAGGLSWTAEEGWRNSPEASAGTAGADFDRAFRYYAEGRHSKAARALSKLVKKADGAVREDALILLAECHLARTAYRKAFHYYEKFIEQYPGSRHTDRATEGELEIAKALLAGARQRLLFTRIWRGYGVGQGIVDKIVSRRPFSDYAREGQLALARSYFRRKLYIESESAYRQYMVLFPSSAAAPAAIEGIAASLVNDARGPGYDPLPYYRAEAAATDLLRQYPQSGPAGRGAVIREKARSKLAEHYHGIAQWYIKRGKAESALVYLRKVAKEYPGTPVAHRAAVLAEALGKVRAGEEGGDEE